MESRFNANHTVLQSHESDSRTAGAVNGAGIDTREYEECVFVLNMGDIAATGTVNLKVQESSDDGSADAYADVPGAAITALGDTDDDGVFCIAVRTRGRERYLRAVLTTGVAASDASVTALLLRKKYRPVTQAAEVIEV